MARCTATQKLRRQAARRKQTTKDVRFTYQGYQLKVAINKHDDAAAIYTAFYEAVRPDGDIEIVNQRGDKLYLGYTHIKDNGTVHVRKVPQRTQGPLSNDATAVQTRETLAKIVTTWGLESPLSIFPDPRWAPRELNLDGGRANPFDTTVPILHPLDWPRTFTAALYQLSKAATHHEAIAAVIKAASKRHKTNGHKQQAVMEVMTHDIKTVTKEFAALRLADTAVNAHYTEKMVGGLSGALLEASLQGVSAFTVATRHDGDGA